MLMQLSFIISLTGAAHSREKKSKIYNFNPAIISIDTTTWDTFSESRASKTIE